MDATIVQGHDIDIISTDTSVPLLHDTGTVEEGPLIQIQGRRPMDLLHSAAEPSRGPSLSTLCDLSSDVGSVHSMPTAHGTGSLSSAALESPAILDSEPSSISNHQPVPSSPSHSQTFQESTTPYQQRRARHRSAVEVRSPNRLSGFFTSLMSRREFTASATRQPIREDTAPPVQSQSTSARPSESISRPSSPHPIRSVTPPPSLPPPTLLELGLSLSVLTSDLSPSHFSTPPASGAFLGPHYLLLCHAQGLDVLPLISPPAPQPYALVRRVSFKSVVVMEQRGVLVAIAGRRDGVRVYALEEVKKAIEWRMDVEVRRERDRLRRETIKKSAMRSIDANEYRDSTEKARKSSLSTPPPGDRDRPRTNLLRKASHGPMPLPPPLPPVPLIPRPPTPRTPTRKPILASVQITPHHAEPSGQPPPYINTETSDSQTMLRSQPSIVSLRARPRRGSVNNVLSAAPRRNAETARANEDESKADWVESSDDEAIDIVAAGTSGSQALDERTSASLSASLAVSTVPMQPIVAQPISAQSRSTSGTGRRNRPSNLDLSLARSNSIVPPEPSPAPTLLTLRQALSHSPPSILNGRHIDDQTPDPETPFAEGEDEDEDIDGQISLAQALLESRLPDLPPIGSRTPQQPIILTSNSPTSNGNESSNPLNEGYRSSNADQPVPRRRRWSVLIGSPTQETTPSISNIPLTAPPRDGIPGRFTRSHSFRSQRSQTPSLRSATEPPSFHTVPTNGPLQEETPSTLSSYPSRSSRFIPRILSNAFNGRRSDERSPVLMQGALELDGRKPNANQIPPQLPPPKLEYVKLPGTKNALMIKAVETAKKSFLAILCGENGEKVELFAGTYRTALGLSRTFILPDSPRSLELQLQGDDLVEVFLVFSQNVFGLEPATVRVREVRIGRAERRAARRRARGNRTGESSVGNDVELQDEETNVNVSIGVSVSVGPNVIARGDGPDRPTTPTLVATDHPNSQFDRPLTPIDHAPSMTTAHPEELIAVATAHMGPYTTFQQLSFAPKFPLASIADEYIIPPTYPSFMEYRTEHEPAGDASTGERLQVQFSPPGLPVPTPTAPPKWYYRDPKNVVHGPWKASLMQAWYKDGLLPPDLPVRREEDDDFTLLKDLRLQCVDPTQPFRSPPVPDRTTFTPEAEKPLLSPISLLSQPRHFGPPALFFSSRGGHSTTIVDARGRSVLKGRFIWSNDDSGEDSTIPLTSKMGDIKRLEAFDVQDRSILVAMRQGGLEAVDLCDALLKPADESRTVLPQFNPPLSNVNRRAPFVWKIGTPIASSPTPLSALAHKSKGTFGHLTSKKANATSTKSPGSKVDSLSNEFDLDPGDEVLFLGRQEDEIYFCERNSASFRILRLSPQA